MPDFAKCQNHKCSMNDHCLRYTAKESVVQSYHPFKPKVDKKNEFECEFLKVR